MAVIDDFVIKSAFGGTVYIEERIRLKLQPKPKWLPKKLYWKVVKRLIVIESSSK